jgi:hypothetical protein
MSTTITTSVNLSFTTAAQAVFTLRDMGTGIVTESDLATVTDSYASLTQGDKATARTWTETQRDQAVRDMDIAAARAWMTIREALVTVSVRPQVDPKVAAIRTAALLTVAAGRIAQTFDFDAAAIRNYTVTESDTATIERLSKIVGGTGTKAPRGSVQAYVDDAFVDVEPGTFLTCGEIARAAGAPSDGAIAARLFPRDGSACTLTGVEPRMNADRTNQGAVKIA